jgi:hypothetical protein
LRYCQGGLDMFQAGYELDSNRRYTDAIRARLPSAWTRLLNAMPGSCRSPARSVTLYPLATLTARVDWLTLMSYSARWPGPKPSRCFADRNYARAARTPLDPRYPPPGPRLPHQPPPAHATVRHPHQPPSGIHTGRAPPPSTPHGWRRGVAGGGWATERRGGRAAGRPAGGWVGRRGGRAAGWVGQVGEVVTLRHQVNSAVAFRSWAAHFAPGAVTVTGS